ncbi:unnamed protein product, partial [Iphiclides podalirius]
MWLGFGAARVSTSTPNPTREQIPIASNSASDISIVEPPSLVPIEILDHSMESPDGDESPTHPSEEGFSAGLSLFVIEPAHDCPCSDERLLSEEDERNDATFIK